ncbi:MAG TPA: response regulator [Terriglobales bacterium]|nr:response regulator [Terriglobales bacterium]
MSTTTETAAAVKNILIVDDDPQILSMLTDLLKMSGFQVETAPNGAAGLEKISHNHYDLMLCDVWMPSMTGLELLEKMSGMSAKPPVIMMTADDTPDTVLKAVRNHALQVVGKPFKTQAILELIKQTLDEPVGPHIEVVSARPEWVELLVPCELRSADRVHALMLKLKGDLPESVRDSVGQAFRELLHNAIEWGGRLDANQKVKISFVRAKRMLLYRIADPGDGFDFKGLAHAAISNPPDDPIGHMRVREEKGLRPGGLGLMITQSLVDELIYNESQNEVICIKYLD